MVDIALAVAFIGLLTTSLILARSIAVFTALVFVTASFTGALVQFTAVGWRSFTLRELQIWVLVGLIVVVVGAFLVRQRTQWSKQPTLIIVISSGIVALAFLITRLMAPSSPEVLSSVGYLITRPGAEDNAKWLNTTAQLAQGTPLDSWASVGGPLVLVFTLCATFISALSVLLYGGVNEVAVAAGTVLLSEHMLVVLAPFALAPILALRARGRTVPIPIALLAIIIVIATVAWPLEFGHVTLQYTVLAFTLWIGFFLVPGNSPLLRGLITIGIALTAMVWFPIAPIALMAMLGVVTWSVRTRQWRLLSAVVLAGILLSEYLNSAIRYAIGIPDASAGPTGTGGAARGVVASEGVLPLFDSPGGTAVASTMLLILAALAAAGAVVYFVQRGFTSQQIAMRFAPVILLASYAWMITIVDFWAVGAGPNYASLKVVYTTILPILATTIMLALLALDRHTQSMTPLRWAVAGGVLVILTIDPFISRTAAQMRPELWPSTANFPYWAPAEVRPTGEQPLTSNPIACVYLPPGADAPSALPFGGRAYACSRLLAGLAGADREANAIVQWQLREWLNNNNLWDENYPFFTLIDPTIRARSVILLDTDDRVIGIEPFERLFTRYAPTE